MDDPTVSRHHGIFTCTGPDGDWWLRNTGKLPIELPDGALMLSGHKRVIDAGYTRLVINSSKQRSHLVEVRLIDEGDRHPRSTAKAKTLDPETVYELSPRERLVVTALVASTLDPGYAASVMRVAGDPANSSKLPFRSSSGLADPDHDHGRCVVIALAVGLAQTGSSSGCLDGDIGRCFTDVITLPDQTINGITSGTESAAGGVLGNVAGSAWDSICRSFADAFTAVLQWFGGVFASMPDPDLGSIRGVYAISLSLGMIVAMFLLVIQAGSVLWTRSGAPLAQALTGVAKAALASLLTLTVAAQLMKASDQLAAWIITSSGVGMDKFSTRLVTTFTSALGPTIPSVLLLVFGLLGVLIVLVLWFELVLRNAVFTILVATAPIAAAGHIGATTQEWWRKLVKAAIQLTALKPVIALVFALGFTTVGTANGITGLVSGMALLFMAVFAWPTIARFFTFTGAMMGGAMGVGALVGAVANRSAAGGPAIDPAAFGQFSERQAMSANAARSAVGGAGVGDSAGGRSATAAAAGPAGIAAAAVQTLHKTINAVASRMEQQAGHAGLEGANPTAYPGGYPSYGSVRLPRTSSAWNSPPESPSHGGASAAPTRGKQ
jgi:hypothetical protein